MQRLSFAVAVTGLLAVAGPAVTFAAPLRSQSVTRHAQGTDCRSTGVQEAIHHRTPGRHAYTTRLSWDTQRRGQDDRDPSRSSFFDDSLGGYQYGGNGTYAYGPNGGLPVYSAGAYSPGPRIIHIPRGYGLGDRND